MFKNYFTTAFRNMVRHKLFSLINIGGLAIGLAACILIFLFVKDELSYESNFSDIDNAYRLEAAYKQDEGDFPFMAVSPGRLRDTLADEYANEISSIVRLHRTGHLLKQGNDTFIETFWFADAGFFDIFDIEMVAGSREAVFNDNTSVIITQSMAQKYFGDVDPIGQILDPDDEDYAYKVVGVMKDLPENTHLTIDFLTMFDPARYVNAPWVATVWLSSNVYTYIKLNDGVSADAIETSFPDFLDRNVVRSEQPGLSGEPSEGFILRLMPVKDIHLHSTGRFQFKLGGDIKVVYSFSIIALLILFIASINFINLSTARSSQRSREIALRKVVGASRKQLITQFLGEAWLMVLIALILALAIVEIALPWFGEFVAKLFVLDYASDPMTSLVLIGLLIVVGLGAGIHPAMQITRFRPASVLRANQSGANAGSKLRVVLVTLQFAISIGLIATTMIVNAQREFTSNKDLGFKTENRLMLTRMNSQYTEPVRETIREEIRKLPGVLDTAYTARFFPLQGFWDERFQKIGENNNNTYSLENVPGGPNYLKFFGARLVAGRLFGEEYQADAARPSVEGDSTRTINVVLNRTAVGRLDLGTPEEAIGQSFRFKSYDSTLIQMIVVGVVEDMHFRTLRDEVASFALQINENILNVLNVHIMEGRREETVNAIRMIWKKHVPAYPMDLSFMDERFGRLYAADKQRGEMFGYFSIFAIIVSCLGLFGLSAFTAQQRTKEIGVRKVFGAENGSIIRLLVWQFSKPVIVANAIAWPVVWYMMNEWLSGFAYRIDLTVTPFVVAGVIALAVAWGTVSLHAWRVARTNPIHALRYE